MVGPEKKGHMQDVGANDGGALRSKLGSINGIGDPSGNKG